jgi:hypothetical protein
MFRHRGNKSVDADVGEFLNSLPLGIRRVVAALRAAVRRTIPHALESVVWGSLSYHRPEVGGRVKGAVCLIVVKKGQVRLDFIHGIRLGDPSGLLQGHQVSKRWIPIETIADSERVEVAALIREAAALDPTEWEKLSPNRRRRSAKPNSSSGKRRKGDEH